MTASLRAQWLILIAGLLFIGSLFPYYLYREYQQTGERESNRLLGRIRIVSSNVQEKLETTDRILQTLANPDAPFFLPDRRHLETLIQASPGLRAILIVDANGKVTDSNLSEA